MAPLIDLDANLFSAHHTLTEGGQLKTGAKSLRNKGDDENEPPPNNSKPIIVERPVASHVLGPLWKRNTLFGGCPKRRE